MNNIIETLQKQCEELDQILANKDYLEHKCACGEHIQGTYQSRMCDSCWADLMAEPPFETQVL